MEKPKDKDSILKYLKDIKQDNKYQLDFNDADDLLKKSSIKKDTNDGKKIEQPQITITQDTTIKQQQQPDNQTTTKQVTVDNTLVNIQQPQQSTIKMTEVCENTKSDNNIINQPKHLKKKIEKLTKKINKEIISSINDIIDEKNTSIVNDLKEKNKLLSKECEKYKTDVTTLIEEKKKLLSSITNIYDSLSCKQTDNANIPPKKRKRDNDDDNDNHNDVKRKKTS